jgi:hypothetical protein
MRNLIIVIAFLSMAITGCNTADKEELKTNAQLSMAFEGNWERTFQLGVDSLQYVYYNIYSDSIEYIMEGPLPLNYTMMVDTFVSEDNRIVTTLKDVHYVMFIKNFSVDSLSLFKEQMDSRAEALARPFPAHTVSGHFSSWYTYYSKK